METKEKKMKASMFVHPATSKGKTIACLFLGLLLVGVWPGIYLFNQAIVIGGIPLMLIFPMLYILLVTGVLCLANHWKVY